MNARGPEFKELWGVRSDEVSALTSVRGTTRKIVDERDREIAEIDKEGWCDFTKTYARAECSRMGRRIDIEPRPGSEAVG